MRRLMSRNVDLLVEALSNSARYYFNLNRKQQRAWNCIRERVFMTLKRRIAIELEEL